MKRVLVLGAYGNIGSHVARGLVAQGHEVIGLGRDTATARRVLPGYNWIFKDLRDLTTPGAWLPLLDKIDVVVNCAGALQVNPKDSLIAVHLHAIGALVLACEKEGVGLVHFSPTGADNPDNGDLAYFRTKAEGDALIRESSTDWWIFRPGLVLTQSAMGAAAILRIQASVPYAMVAAMVNTQIKTVSMADVVEAVSRAINGDVPARTEADLVEAKAHGILDVARAMRAWLGFDVPLLTVYFPFWIIGFWARCADVASWLGWRAPYRTTAIEVMKRGITGNHIQTKMVLGRPALPMEQTLLRMRAGIEDRLRARLELLAPFVFLTLALHWIIAGAIAVANAQTGIDYMIAAGHSPYVAALLVWLLASVTFVLGIMLLVRRWAHRVLVIMALFSIFYLAGATIVLPELWADPLGPLVKVIPIIVLTLVARVLIDSR
ncbi:MAG: SDR family oxidoreductase [Maritimibacter sp.]